MPVKKVLITGAAGFVGCRLAEKLVSEAGYEPVALVRRYHGRGIPRLARLPIKWAFADIMDLPSLTDAFKGAEIVVHLAYGDAAVNVMGTENVLEAAYRNQVEKVIHMSTAAVHGQDPKGPSVVESSPFESSRDEYRSSKAQAEVTISKFQAKHRLPVVILRPPLIYGPFSRSWTVRLIQEVQNGAILVDGGKGTANLVYIDNLIEAILLAMKKDSADGEALFVVDDERPTWKTVYERYAAMAGAETRLSTMTVAEIERLRKAMTPSTLTRWVLEPLDIGREIVLGAARTPAYRNRLLAVPWIRFLAKEVLPKKSKDRIKGVGQNGARVVRAPSPPRVSLPAPDMISLYAATSRFSNEKIKRLLGYVQKVSLDDGMARTREWLRYYRYIPG